MNIIFRSCHFDYIKFGQFPPLFIKCIYQIQFIRLAPFLSTLSTSGTYFSRESLFSGCKTIGDEIMKPARPFFFACKIVSLAFSFLREITGVITKLPKLFGILVNISINLSDLTIKCTKPFGFARFAATFNHSDMGKRISK